MASVQQQCEHHYLKVLIESLIFQAYEPEFLELEGQIMNLFIAMFLCPN